MTEIDLGPAALCALAATSVAAGWAMQWVFKTCSDQAAIARARSLIVAHLLEFRLFGDEPALVLRAQWEVARHTLRLTRLLLVPALIMLAPMVLLFVQLDAVFGKAPLRPGETSVVTVNWQGDGEAPRLETSPGIGVETPPVRAPLLHEVSWRIRPAQPGVGVLRFVSGEKVWTKSLSAGRGWSYISERRVGLGAGYPLHSTEWPLPPGEAMQSIEVRYGAASLCGFHWLIWFLLFSGIAFFAAGK